MVAITSRLIVVGQDHWQHLPVSDLKRALGLLYGWSMRAWRRENAWFRGYVLLGLRIRVYTSGVAPDPGIPRSRGTYVLHAHARRIVSALIVNGRPRF